MLGLQAPVLRVRTVEHEVDGELLGGGRSLGECVEPEEVDLPELAAEQQHLLQQPEAGRQRVAVGQQRLVGCQPCRADARGASHHHVGGGSLAGPSREALARTGFRPRHVAGQEEVRRGRHRALGVQRQAEARQVERRQRGALVERKEQPRPARLVGVVAQLHRGQVQRVEPHVLRGLEPARRPLGTDRRGQDLGAPRQRRRLLHQPRLRVEGQHAAGREGRQEVRVQQPDEPLGVLRQVIVQPLLHARREERDAFEQALDVRVAVFERIQAEHPRLVGVRLGEGGPSLAEVAELAFVVAMQHGVRQSGGRPSSPASRTSSRGGSGGPAPPRH